jgi:hypothetical protein
MATECGQGMGRVQKMGGVSVCDCGLRMLDLLLENMHFRLQVWN